MKSREMGTTEAQVEPYLLQPTPEVLVQDLPLEATTVIMQENETLPGDQEAQVILAAMEFLKKEGLCLGNKSVLVITHSRRSKRLEEKRAGSSIGCKFSRKPLHRNLDTGTSNTTLHIFNIIPDDMLFSLAHTCDIDMGLNDNKFAHNLSQLRALDSSRVDELVGATNP